MYSTPSARRLQVPASDGNQTNCGLGVRSGQPAADQFPHRSSAVIRHSNPPAFPDVVLRTRNLGAITLGSEFRNDERLWRIISELEKVLVCGIPTDVHTAGRT